MDLQNTNEKFGCFLRSALDVLSQILELATLQDIGKVQDVFGFCLCLFAVELFLFVVLPGRSVYHGFKNCCKRQYSKKMLYYQKAG